MSYSFKWNDYKENIVSSYQDLRKDSEFSDVTLLCEGDQQIEAHKIILTSTSHFFSRVLKRNSHSHPLIYMRGVSAKDLTAVVDFIYHGETDILQDDLDGFMALAEELQLKGISGSQEVKKEPKEELKQPIPLTSKLETLNKPTVTKLNIGIPVDVGKMLIAAETTMEDLRVKLDSMMKQANDGENKWKCTVCGKATNGPSAARNMRRHIEIHMEGLSYPCNQCGKIKRSSMALSCHMTANHRK